MSVYVELLHGRKTPDEELHDWGTNGPVLGPFKYVHTTYLTDITCCRANEDVITLKTEEGLVIYNGIYYGDWSVFGDEVLADSVELLNRLETSTLGEVAR